MNAHAASERYAEVKACRSCGAGKLATILSLGDMPLTDSYPLLGDTSDEALFPLEVALCRECSLVQILATVAPEEIFSDYQYYSSFSESLLKHSERNALDLIKSRNLGTQHLVVELASNDGYLLHNFTERGIPVLGIDPAKGPAEAARKAGIPTLVEFFGPELAVKLRAEGRLADVLIANNVLAHVPDLNGFVEGMSTILADDGVAIVEVPYLRDLIEKCEFDTIYHEHLCYFSVTALAHLFRRHDLHMNDLQQLPIHGGSLRLFIQKTEAPSLSVGTYLSKEREAGMTEEGSYAEFAARATQVQESLRSMLEDLRSQGSSIAGYGAAAKGTVLLNSSRIGADLVDFVADRNPHKQGRMVPGLKIPIVDPAVILEKLPDYLLLLSWNLRDEVMAQQKEFRDKGGKFIVPIPSPDIF